MTLPSSSMRFVLPSIMLQLDFITFVSSLCRQMDQSGLVSLSGALSNDLYTLWSSMRYQLFIFKYIKFINYLYTNVFKSWIIHHQNPWLKRRKHSSHSRLWNLMESRFSMIIPCNVFLNVLYFCIEWSWYSLSIYFSITFLELLDCEGDVLVYLTDIIELFKGQ
jgi:hypothetical protein